MSLGHRACIALALSFSLGLTGCIVEVEPIDPVGTDASVSGSWTIEGAAASAASCAANGITHVRVRVFDGADYADPASLVFPCEDGSFDTRPSAVLADGIWTIQLLAVNSDAASGGVVVDEGPMMTFDTVVEGGHIAIPKVDFMGDAPAGTFLQGSWTINAEAPTADNCSSLGVDEVHVEIVDGPGGARTLKYMCADGGFIEEVEPGSYEIRVVASNLATGEITETEITESFTLPDGDTYIINGGSPIAYVGGFNPLGSDAKLEAIWDIGGVTGGEKSCDAVGGAEVDFIFYPADDTARETEGVVVHGGAPCEDGAFESASAILAAGTYLVSAELYDSGDNLISAVDAVEPVTVTAGTPLSLALDFRLDSSTIHAVLRYDDPGTGIPGSCIEPQPAGVGMVMWNLTMGAELIADSGGEVECVDFVNVMSGPSSAPLEPGSYNLYFEGALPSDSSAKRWAGSCIITIDAPGGLGYAECIADYMT